MTHILVSIASSLSNRLRFICCVLGSILVAAAALPVYAATVPTTTTLDITSAGRPVASVASGTVVVLDAVVTPTAVGLVKFCDGAATYCTDEHLLGTGQVTSSGLATYAFSPGAGKHSYKAIFVGTTVNASSTSATAALTVSDSRPISTTITATGVPGNYTLTTTIAGRIPVATGSVSFLDTTNANSSLGTTALTSPSALTFAAPYTPNAAALGSTGVAVGDFRGRGITDLVVANFRASNGGGDAVTVFLGNGDGTFNSGVTYGAGSSPTSIAVGDFNSDGILDIVTANSGDGSVTVLLGNGDGTFKTAVPYSIGRDPNAVAVGDFNGDGIPDILTTNSYDGSIAVLLGNGDGTFKAPLPYQFSDNNARSISVGDFNGDGLLDLAAVSGESNIVTVLLGNGDGTFKTGVPYEADVQPFSVAVGDFNGDGIPDLATANVGDVTVLLGNGDGTFKAGVPYTAGNLPNSVAVGDFNGDGILDIVAANSGDNTVTVLLGNGDGTFKAGMVYPVGDYPVSVAIGDFDGDGHPDLATANLNGEPVTVLLNQVPTSATATLTGVVVPGGGTHVIDASYAGDTNYSPRLSDNTVALIGTQIPTTLTLSSSLSASTFGQQVMLTAKLSPYNSGNLSTNVENVLFQSNGANLGTGSLSSGVAVLNITSLPVGADVITAAFGGDANFVTSISPATTVTVAQAGQKPTIAWANPAPIPYGTALSATQLNATVSASGTSIPGTYTYSPTAGTVPAAGTDTLTVTFTPTDTTNYSALTATVSLVVNKATPTITWAAPTAIPYGTALTAAQLNAASTVSGAFAYTPAAGIVPGAGTQTLSVVLTPNDTLDYTTATATVSLVVNAATPTLTFAPIANQATGAAPFTVSAASVSPGVVTYAVTSGPATVSGVTVTVTGVGTVVLTATQAAAGNYAAATAMASFTVTSGTVSDFTLAPGHSGTAQTVNAGAAATYSFQLAPTGGAYPGSVSFAASGLPNGASFNFSPALVPASSGPVTVSFTVDTSAATALNRGFSLGGRMTPVAFGLLLLPLAGVRRLRKSGRKAMDPLLVLLLLLGGAMALSGCAGGGSPQVNESLQTQTSSITISATSGTISHSTTVTLTVSK